LRVIAARKIQNCAGSVAPHMRKTSSIRGLTAGIYAVRPKAAILPRRSKVQRVTERDDDEDASEQAPPPPGMGKLVDKRV